MGNSKLLVSQIKYGFTYIKTKDGWLYLAAIIDLVGWSMSS
ncbi:transposase [Wolbachia endosymbiont of Armadillidium vulgare str. wVulC]|nr:transposase [Wolbachia endosymbiont of Armadillidium vulgare str. wVulC]